MELRVLVKVHFSYKQNVIISKYVQLNMSHVLV
jgi:hypothetical protein